MQKEMLLPSLPYLPYLLSSKYVDIYPEVFQACLAASSQCRIKPEARLEGRPPFQLPLRGHPYMTSTRKLDFCTDLIQPIQSACNLGIWLDSDCSMTTHINKTTRSCYASLRKICSIGASLSFDVRKLRFTHVWLSTKILIIVNL